LSEDASTVVVLSGNVDVRSIHISFQKLEDAFAGALGTGVSLAIDLAQVVDADVTLVQRPRNPVSPSTCAPRRGMRCWRRSSAVDFSATHPTRAPFSGERNK
jgi:hypothetical protein